MGYKLCVCVCVQRGIKQTLRDGFLNAVRLAATVGLAGRSAPAAALAPKAWPSSLSRPGPAGLPGRLVGAGRDRRARSAVLSAESPGRLPAMALSTRARTRRVIGGRTGGGQLRGVLAW